jgi:predicted transcriptional regulator
MAEEEKTTELLNFFKALADENRLKIVGLLAQGPSSVEKLAEALNIGMSTTSHHLSRLSKAGLVSARTEGHYYIYSLHTDVLREMAQQLLHEEQIPRLSGDAGEDDFDRKVLDTFLDSEGRITTFPAQEKKFLALLRYVIQAFEPGQRYSEKQVNEKLLRFNEDTAVLRRSLVDFGFMSREGGGGDYWRTNVDDHGNRDLITGHGR